MNVGVGAHKPLDPCCTPRLLHSTICSRVSANGNVRRTTIPTCSILYGQLGVASQGVDLGRGKSNMVHKGLR